MPKSPLDEYKKEEKEIDRQEAETKQAATAAKSAIDKLNRFTSFSNKVKKELSGEPE